MEAPDLGTDVTRLGILGGTFDPIHLGHLVAASEALYAFSLDRVVLVPAGRPWQKAAYSDAEDRLLMTTLAAATHPRLAVSRIELDRPGPTYTVETLEAFRDLFPHAALFFIMGADVAADMSSWHRAGDIADLGEVIAVTRPGRHLRAPSPDEVWPAIHELEIPALDISSTDIRDRVAEGKPFDYLVSAQVARFIREQGLYVNAGISKSG